MNHDRGLSQNSGYPFRSFRGSYDEGCTVLGGHTGPILGNPQVVLSDSLSVLAGGTNRLPPYATENDGTEGGFAAFEPSWSVRDRCLLNRVPAYPPSRSVAKRQ